MFPYLLISLLSSCAVNGAPSSQADEPQPQAAKDYGQLVVKPGTYTGEIRNKPWSVWWYPLSETSLYEPRAGQLSPLQLYDQMVFNRTGGQKSPKKAFNPKSASHEAEYSKERLKKGSQDYFGLCGGAAFASVLLPEPTTSITLDGVTFPPVARKALAVRSYEGLVGLTRFGTAFRGMTSRKSADPDDIWPHEFHQVLWNEVYVKKIPVIMDYDAEKPVWHAPIYKVEFVISPEPTTSEIMHVKATVYYAKFSLRSGEDDPKQPIPDMKGLKYSTYEYTYDLFGKTLPDGSFEVNEVPPGRPATYASIWTNESYDHLVHPDYLLTFPSSELKDPQTGQSAWMVDFTKLRREKPFVREYEPLDYSIVDEIILGNQ